MSQWRRSRFCEDAACVEAAFIPGAVLVRNTADPATVLAFTDTEWAVFLEGVRSGDFNPTKGAE